MSEAADRMVPYHCPYCGGEDLRPHEEPAESTRPAQHGAWECRGCTRVFSVKFIGLVVKR
jgi:hypothetical protein